MAGIIRWLVNIVDKVIALIIIIPVRAAKPPSKTKIEIVVWLFESGKDNSHKSAEVKGNSCNIPTSATGKVKILITNKYKGKSHFALSIKSVLPHSTTLTLNCLGKAITPTAPSKIKLN